jgi:GntR family transcriptional regulator/MocR family aminotransferase
MRLRESILSGAFGTGTKLPSTRELAEQLGISRTVVVLVYEQLIAEGLAEGRTGSGTYVSEQLRTLRKTSPEQSMEPAFSRYGKSAIAAWTRLDVPRRRGVPRYDFAYGRSDLDDFPFEIWQRTLLRCARKAPVSELDYGSAAGVRHCNRRSVTTCDGPDRSFVNLHKSSL